MEKEGFQGDSWQPEQETKRRSRKEDDNLKDEEEVGREDWMVKAGVWRSQDYRWMLTKTI